MNRPYVMGIDPGLSGAVAVIDVGQMKVVEVIDMPLRTDPKGKNWIDVYALAAFVDKHGPQTSHCVIEEVGVMTGVEGRVSMFRFGLAAGIAHGVVASSMIPMVLVKPAVWKGAAGLGRDKNESRERAAKMFPKDSELFKRKKDDGRAEAALLAFMGHKLGPKRISQ